MHGMITALDDVVGNVTQKLKDIGIYENTIILFSSDNGAISGFDGNNPLKGFLFNIVRFQCITLYIIEHDGIHRLLYLQMIY